MKMFVANASRQTNHFAYRKAGGAGPYQQEIPAGGQIQVSGDLAPEDVEAILKQHTKYGLIHIDQIPRSQGVCTLCYLVGERPIRLERIQELLLRNDRVLRQRGKDAREAAAIALNEQIEQSMLEQQMPGRLAELDVSVVEAQPARVRGERNSPLERELAEADPVAEGIKVRDDAPPPPPDAKTGPKRRRTQRG